MELTKEQRQRLKEARLQDYLVKIFEYEMNIAAYEAIGDQKSIEEAQVFIEDLKRAYKAVESLE